MSVTATAGLAGISQAYLSMIERGQRPVTKRAVLEGLAHALRVAPHELTEQPWERDTGLAGRHAHASLVVVATALDAYEFGDDPDIPVRAWPDVVADVKELDRIHVDADYARQGDLACRLLGELHAYYVRAPSQRREVLLGLIHCYRSVGSVSRRFGDGSGLSLVAAKAAQRCAEELGSPQWRGLTTWVRGQVSGSFSRAQQYHRVVRMAEELSPELDDHEVVQAYGMLHLSAAMAAAAQADRETAITHLDEAATVADRLDVEVGTFGRAWFGRTNVGIWRVAIELELGNGSKVAELARTVHVETIPSVVRQAEFYTDVGRALLVDQRTWETRERGLALLLHAEGLASQRLRNDVFVREAVTDQLRLAGRRDTFGRELRGLAHRIGITPHG